jgi:ABC-2 type transport system permease protein
MSRFVRTDIRHGKLNSFLIKPQNYPLSLLANELSYKIIALTFCFILFPIISYLAPTYVSFPSSSIIIPFVLCIIISYGISFTIQLIIGFSAFYLGNSTALIQLRYILELVFSGELAPLTFFPKPLQIIAAWLPFQYRIFIPAQIFLGNITGITIWQHIGIALLWLAGLLLISFFLWRAGLKRYAGYGG